MSDFRRLQLAHHLFERTALTSLTGNSLVACQTLTVLGNFTSTAFVFNNRETVTSRWRTGQAEDFDRHGRTGFLHPLAVILAMYESARTGRPVALGGAA